MRSSSTPPCDMACSDACSAAILWPSDSEPEDDEPGDNVTHIQPAEAPPSLSDKRRRLAAGVVTGSGVLSAGVALAGVVSAGPGTAGPSEAIAGATEARATEATGAGKGTGNIGQDKSHGSMNIRGCKVMLPPTFVAKDVALDMVDDSDVILDDDGHEMMMMGLGCAGPSDDEEACRLARTRKKPGPWKPVYLPKHFVEAASSSSRSMHPAEMLTRFRTKCLDMYVKKESEPIVWTCMLERALDHSQMFKHCQAGIMQRLQTRRCAFYIGITSDPLFRWTNESFGHKWNRQHRFRTMHILLKDQPAVVRSMEVALIESVYADAELCRLIINCQQSPSGPVHGDEVGYGYLYVCFS